MHVLFVCAANICRSPMSVALFERRRAESYDGAEPADEAVRSVVSISSAGLLPGGSESPPEVVQAFAELGIGIAAHRGTQVSPELVPCADVVVCTARRHTYEVVVLDAAAFPRTFELKVLVHRGDLAGPRPAGESVDAWTRRLHHGRHRTDLVGDAVADDIPGPLRGGSDDVRATAFELGALVERMAGLLWTGHQIRSAPA